MSISQVKGVALMPDDLKSKVLNMNPFNRKYCEYRSMGIAMADAAEKAGSTAKDREARTRVGWNIENKDNKVAKEYILWLQEQRARAAHVDRNEVVEMLRNSYQEAMSNKKFGDAIKAAEHLGNMIGLFSAQGKGPQKGMSTTNREQPIKDEHRNLTESEIAKVEAFNEEDETIEDSLTTDKTMSEQSEDTKELLNKVSELQKLYKELNRK